MILRIGLTLTASLFLTTSAFAQERMRSAEYTGEDAIELCYDWQTDFEFERCDRIPVPGAGMGQTYTLADGTKRTLTADPRTAVPFDPVAAAAEDGAVAPSADLDTPPREEVSSSISSATMVRSNPSSLEDDSAEAQSSGHSPEDSDAGTLKSKIVAEEFVLPPVVAVMPGRSEIMQMATGHLNRIETPFSDPMVRTSAQADALNVEFDKNYIYVSVTQPVTLFIHQRGYPDPAIVVSLVPQRIAPRQVKLSVPPTITAEIAKNVAAEAKATGAATSAETGPRANTKGITRAPAPAGASASLPGYIKTFSNGRIPRGFTQVQMTGFKVETFCKSASGASFSFRQGAAVASKDYIIVRGMVTSTREVNLDEKMCANHPDTLAVAFSPRTRVSKDHPADFFVLIRRPTASVQSARGN